MNEDDGFSLAIFTPMFTFLIYGIFLVVFLGELSDLSKFAIFVTSLIMGAGTSILQMMFITGKPLIDFGKSAGLQGNAEKEEE